MQSTQGFLIVNLYALLLIISVSIVFFKKARQKKTEDNTYSKLLITSILVNISGIVLGLIVSSNLNSNELLLIIFNKIYLACLLFWIALLTFYAIYISFITEEKTKKIEKLIKYFTIFSIILIFILPMNIDIKSNQAIVDGPAILYTYILFGIGFITQMVCLLSDFKNLINKKYIPIYLLAFLGIIILIIQMLYPHLNYLINPTLIFIIIIMYHTIENPDIKMVNELNLAKNRAEKANNSKTEFLSSMSHEIRTPLNAIVGFSQVLLNKNLPEDSKEEIKDIISASEILLGIVNGILDISKIEANKLEIINNEYSTQKVLSELIALTKARMGEKSLDFRTHFDSALPEYLYGDSSRIKQIILNLLTNSVKYTKEGYLDFKINTVIKGDVCRLIISVEDSGVGIKAENINKLFKKFERLNEGGSTSIEGTGLGLAITQKLVELMGGKIFVQSVFGQGSKFTVIIDQQIINKTYVEEPIIDDTQLIKNFDFSDKIILVVDDNNLNLKVADRLLTSYGIQVETIDNGFDLIEKIKAGENYDLLLLDDMMPKMSGTAALKNLRDLPNYKIPTIALTANAIEGMREKYISEGFDDYLAKPIDKSELNRVIIKYLYNN